MAKTRIFRKQNDGTIQHHQHADQGGPGGPAYEYADIRNGPCVSPAHIGYPPGRQAMCPPELPARNPVYPVYEPPGYDRAVGRQGRPQLEQYGTTCLRPCCQPAAPHGPRGRPHGGRRRGREISWRQAETGYQQWDGEWDDGSTYSGRPAPGRSARPAPRNGQARPGQLETGLGRRQTRSRRRAAEWAKRKRAENGRLPAPTAEGCSSRASPGSRRDRRGGEERPSGPLSPSAEATVGPANGPGAVCKETADKAVGTDERPEILGERVSGSNGDSPENPYGDTVRGGPGSGLEIEPPTLVDCEPISPVNHANDLLNASPRAPDGDAFDVVDYDESLLND